MEPNVIMILMNAPLTLVRMEEHVLIKTHDSESRGQEKAGRTRRTSESNYSKLLFTI